MALKKAKLTGCGGFLNTQKSLYHTQNKIEENQHHCKSDEDQQNQSDSDVSSSSSSSSSSLIKNPSQVELMTHQT